MSKFLHFDPVVTHFLMGKFLFFTVVLAATIGCVSKQKRQEFTPQAWPMHVIDSSLSGADGVKLYDVNHDGRDDIVTGWEESGVTKLYYHPGYIQATQPWPNEIVGETPSVEDAVCCDLDGDDVAEIIASCEGSERNIIVFDRQESQTWESTKLTSANDRMRWMYAECLQVDRKNGLDIIAGGKDDDAALGWFESPADPEDWQAWSWHQISDVGWIMSLLIADINQDGEMDIIISDRKGAARGCRWLENPGPGVDQTAPWKSHLVGGADLEVMFMDLMDLDGDDYPELVVSERTHQSIRIYSCPDHDGVVWHEKTIDLPKDIVHAKAVHCADVDGDQVIDMLVSSNTEGAENHGLLWLDGASLRTNSPQFYPVAGRHTAKFDDIKTVDVDNDGDLDVLTCEENFGPDSRGLGIIWYENTLQQ